MTPLAPREPDILHAAIHDRITQLLRARQLYRRMLRAEWTTNRWECETEVRALLRLARSARRQAEAERVARPDPIDLAKRFAEWSAGRVAPETESELAYGR